MMNLEHKIEHHIWPDRILTDNEWRALKSLSKESRLRRGDLVGNKRFVGYNRACKNGTYLVDEEGFSRCKEKIEAGHTRHKGSVKRWYVENREHHKAKQKERYARCNKRARRSQAKLWEKKNPDAVKAINRRKYLKIRSNPVKAVMQSLRRRLKMAVDAKLLYGRARDRKTVEFLCWLKNHESIGENFHIDHIMPLSKCNLSTKEGQLQANSPYNVRWMTAADNILKADAMPSQHEINQHAVLVDLWLSETGQKF